MKDGTIVVTYYPTTPMITDYLSKPLQGSLFCLHRNTLMGITSEMADQYQMEYAAAKVATAKLTHDRLSG